MLNPDGTRLFFYLKMLCALLFANTFVTLPLILYARLPLAFNLFFLLIVMSLNYILIIVLALFAPNKIYKNKTSKTATILPIVLSPISAMHAPRILTKEIYARFDPLAVAKAFMPPDHFRHLMRKELFRISYAKSGIANEGLREFLNLKEESYHRMLADSGITLQEIFAAPEKQDDSADSYCPLCGTEYLAGPDRCHDCGIGLKPFNSPSACESIPV